MDDPPEPSDEEFLADLPTPSDEAQGESMQQSDSDELPDLPALSDDGEVAANPPVVEPLLFALPTPRLGVDLGHGPLRANAGFWTSGFPPDRPPQAAGEAGVGPKALLSA